MQVKADVRQEEKFDFAKLHDEITELEKRVRFGPWKAGKRTWFVFLCQLVYSHVCLNVWKSTFKVDRVT